MQFYHLSQSRLCECVHVQVLPAGVRAPSCTPPAQPGIILCRISGMHMQRNTCRTAQSLTCLYLPRAPDPYLFTLISYFSTWKATQTAYILAADQVREAVRDQIVSSVVSPLTNSKTGWLTEHWYWSQAITKQKTMKGAKQRRPNTEIRENQSTSLRMNHIQER